MVEMSGWEGAVRDWKTPSAMVERQMFPRQTNKTETGLGDLESLIVVIWEVVGSRVGRLDGCKVSLRLSVVEIRGYEGSGKIWGRRIVGIRPFW
jgi:hypothetical protein